mgnify:CR=1 FL=1
MTNYPIDSFNGLETPFYYYDLNLLRSTIEELKNNIEGYPYKVHYAVKANANPRILHEIKEAGLSIDCVSGGEIEAALAAGFKGDSIAFAGVGKTDNEINLGLNHDIFCFNVESLPELEVINEIAAIKGKIANVAIRVNPNIDAHTHKYITTGLNENKFGINLEQLDNVVSSAIAMPDINLIGLHFHIGSQILDNEPFKMLCFKVNEIQDMFEAKGVRFKIINVGGGLGIDYSNPINEPIPAFRQYFDTFKQNLKLRDGQELHFELGRSIVGQCGSLITRVLYVKNGTSKNFAIVDAGMTDLIRPALYQAHHVIENITSSSTVTEKYDIVGPICESSDKFASDEELPVTRRGDFLALRSAGAYGEIMAMRYNCRRLPGSYFSE